MYVDIGFCRPVKKISSARSLDDVLRTYQERRSIGTFSEGESRESVRSARLGDDGDKYTTYYIYA